MKYLIFAIIANSFVACSHMEVSATGFKVTNMNLGKTEWSPNKFTTDSINASLPLKRTWDGINRETDILKDLGMAFAPESKIPVAVKGVGILGSKFNTPPTPTETVLTK